MKNKTFWVVCLATALTACAHGLEPLYHGEGYQRQLYESLKDEGASPNKQLEALQEQMQKAKSRGAALPPGFRAHLGLLYLRLNQFDQAYEMLQAEKEFFPESTKYMNFLMKKINTKSS
jgi:hypothetical protein